MEETCGDHYNVACPHCGKINHYVTQGVKIEFRKIICFMRQCEHCKKSIYYEAEYKIIVKAFSENPIPEID